MTELYFPPRRANTKMKSWTLALLIHGLTLTYTSNGSGLVLTLNEEKDPGLP